MVRLSEIKETNQHLLPIWQNCKNELISLTHIPLHTDEQIEAVRNRLAKVDLIVKKLYERKLIALISRGYIENAHRISREEFATTTTKLEKLIQLLETTDAMQDAVKVRMRLLAILQNAHISVVQHALEAFLKRYEQEHFQLIAWLERTQSSPARFEKLWTFYAKEDFPKLKLGLSSTDRKQLQLIALHMLSLEAHTINFLLHEPIACE